MKVVIEYLVIHELLQSVHLWHSTMKYMPKSPLVRSFCPLGKGSTVYAGE